MKPLKFVNIYLPDILAKDSLLRKDRIRTKGTEYISQTIIKAKTSSYDKFWVRKLTYMMTTRRELKCGDMNWESDDNSRISGSSSYECARIIVR